jgi:hypothetical protein
MDAPETSGQGDKAVQKSGGRFSRIPTEIWVALITLVGTLYPAYLAGRNQGRVENAGAQPPVISGSQAVGASELQRSMNEVRGEIVQARVKSADKGVVVECTGRINEKFKPDSGMHPWIASEVNGYFYPKAHEIIPDMKAHGEWALDVSESGQARDFSVILFVTDNTGNDQIKGWMDRGLKTGDYAKVDYIYNMIRLDHVDNLRVGDGR